MFSMSATDQAACGPTDRTPAGRDAERPEAVAAADEARRARVVAAARTEQLADLKRLRDVGMIFVDQLERRSRGLLRMDEENAFSPDIDAPLAFARLSRAVRQIIVLEQEIMGLRPVARSPVNADPANAPANANVAASAPEPSRNAGDRTEDERDRGDLNDLDDYDRGPIEDVVGRIKSALGVGSAEKSFAEPSPPPTPPAKGAGCEPGSSVSLHAPPPLAGGGREEGENANHSPGSRPVILSAFLAAEEAAERKKRRGRDPP